MLLDYVATTASETLGGPWAIVIPGTLPVVAAFIYFNIQLKRMCPSY